MGVFLLQTEIPPLSPLYTIVFICYVFSLFLFSLRRKSSTVKDAGRPFSSPIFIYTPFKVIWTNGKNCLENANLADGLSPPLTSWWERRQLGWAVSLFLLTLLSTSKLGDSCDRDREVGSGVPNCDPPVVPWGKAQKSSLQLRRQSQVDRLLLHAFANHLFLSPLQLCGLLTLQSYDILLQEQFDSVLKVSSLKRFLFN